MSEREWPEERLLAALAFDDRTDPESYCCQCRVQVKDTEHRLDCPVTVLRAYIDRLRGDYDELLSALRNIGAWLATEDEWYDINPKLYGEILDAISAAIDD